MARFERATTQLRKLVLYPLSYMRLVASRSRPWDAVLPANVRSVRGIPRTRNRHACPPRPHPLMRPNARPPGRIRTRTLVIRSHAPCPFRPQGVGTRRENRTRNLGFKRPLLCLFELDALGGTP